MIDFSIEPGSADDIASAFSARKGWVLQGVREGMAEAMQDLADSAAERAPKRRGALERAILASPRVRETTSAITGVVNGDVGRLHVALWIEAGIREQAISKTKPMVLIGDDGSPVFFRRRRAFNIPGRPFMNPTLRDMKPTIFDVIRKHVEEATGRQ